MAIRFVVKGLRPRATVPVVYFTAATREECETAREFMIVQKGWMRSRVWIEEVL